MSLDVVTDRLFDGEAFRDGTWRVEIDGGRIARVARHDGPVAESAIDARGASVLPGLVNTHVHIARGGMFEPEEPISIGQVIRNLADTLGSGVTTLGDMGCAAGLAAALRERTRDDPGAGPSMRMAGPLVTAPRGYPLDWMPPLFAKLGVALPCDTERDAGRAVERIARAGMDHVKLAVMHQSYAEAPLPALREPVARAAVEEAHRHGLRAFAHAHSVADYRVALAAGVDALMHSSFIPLDADTVAMVRDAGVVVCPTLWVFESVCLGVEERWDRDAVRTHGVAPRIVRSWRRFAEAWAESGDVVPPGIAGGLAKTRAIEGARVAAANLRLLRDAGVPVAFGTDAAYGYCAHGRPLDEISAMNRAGMDVTACVRAATSAAAELLGLTDRGRIAERMRADVLIVDGDLSRDLGALGRVRDVIAAGRRTGAASFTAQARTAVATVRGLADTAWRGLKGE